MFLDLEEDHFDKFVQKGNSILRPIHYPPIKTKPLGAERAAAHGDINLIIYVFQILLLVCLIIEHKKT